MSEYDERYFVKEKIYRIINGKEVFGELKTMVKGNERTEVSFTPIGSYDDEDDVVKTVLKKEDIDTIQEAAKRVEDLSNNLDFQDKVVDGFDGPDRIEEGDK